MDRVTISRMDTQVMQSGICGCKIGISSGYIGCQVRYVYCDDDLCKCD